MSEIKKYNNISEKLRAYLPRLKPNEKLRFQLNGIYVDKITKKLVCPTSFALIPTDRIFDPWAGKKLANGANEYGYEGAYVDIAFILREVPAPVDSPKDAIIEFGRLEFKRTTAGIIEIIGGHRAMEQILMILFFNNRNSTNVDKPWWIKPVGKSIFHQIETKKAATKTLEGELRIDQAKTAITNMSKEELDLAAAGLMPSRYHHLSENERILGLRAIAANDPNKILDLSKDVEVKTTAFIEECLKAQLINLDKAKSQFVWADDKTKICSIKAGATPHNSLKRFFMTDEGIEVLVSLEKQLELSKQSKKEKTAKAVV